jgi:cellobiose dehydrogenase (acceptor)
MKMTMATRLLLAALLAVFAVDSAFADWSSQTWDVIVVGAGTAGIIVADRLSEAGHSTLLLEQGGKSYGIVGGIEKPAWLNGTDLSRVDVPGLCEYKPKTQRAEKKEKQQITQLPAVLTRPTDSTIFAGKSDLICKPDQVGAFQACTIGGNSAINAGLYFQPPASDWDDYHPEGWHSADVRAAIDRLLKRQPALTSYSKDDKFYLQSSFKAMKKWIVDDAGYSNVSFLDTIDNKDGVFGRPVYNYLEGQRGGPARTYLQSALNRTNFHLESGVHAKYIEQVGGVASAVTVELANGEHKSVRLAKAGRVVLSAGALLSPKILMYSGIGPQEALSKLAAKSFTPYNESSWIVQPQVGQGLFDNPNTFIVLSAPDIDSYVYRYDNPPLEDRDLYLQSRSGPYSFASQTSAFWAYVNHSDGTRTGVQGTVSSSGYGGFTANNTVTLNVYGTSGLLSSGHVQLSDDGKFTALPSPGVYYAHPRDAESIAAFIHSLFQHLPSSTPTSPAKHGLTPLNIARDSTLEEVLQYISTPSLYAVGAVQHWSSSCRIGKCVDADTKVMGTDNIHVVDASILAPLTVNPQFAVMVAAEKGSERIMAVMQGKPCRGRRRS